MTIPVLPGGETTPPPPPLQPSLLTVPAILDTYVETVHFRGHKAQHSVRTVRYVILRNQTEL